ncbi:MAG: hypothetical protein QJT80_00290 [Candidatus Thiocaldithrix dubininis]|jgi:hypothetical protein|uniref:Lipoprotein n=1 Tax=Candidatus Thiocaldithrix dubininis TaxID=3080823 RepID=A0AA95H845_9GAMM|nr:MAG: hypothetical protein QJT80_00290 [Candidatus Thiocaldithrix dubininis]
MSHTTKWPILLIVVAVGACTNAHNDPPADKEITKIPSTIIPTFNTPAAAQTEPFASSSIAAPPNDQKMQEDAACFMLANCRPKQTTESATSSTNATTASSLNNPTDNNSSGGSFGNTQGTTQIINSPNQNVILTQLPANNTVQSLNRIYTSQITTPTANLTQQATFKDVEFNQLGTIDSINAVNGVVKDSNLSGTLDQNFSFKSIEMIQHNSSGSVHAINYMGESIPRR